jgi:hypothetical protein
MSRESGDSEIFWKRSSGASALRKSANRSLSAGLIVLALFEFACGSGGGSSAASSNPSGVGSLCTDDIDCLTPLSCTVNASSLVDGQCSEKCNTADGCVNVDGACLSTGLCVKACEKSSDCPAGTACTDVGWCQRAASGAHCAGIAAACGAESNCDDVPGCYSDYACTGIPVACDQIRNLIECTDSGCDWDIAAMFCSGDPNPCKYGIGIHTCDAILGCYWDATCTGTPTPCEHLSKAQCETVSGCAAVR